MMRDFQVTMYSYDIFPFHPLSLCRCRVWGEPRQSSIRSRSRRLFFFFLFFSQQLHFTALHSFHFTSLHTRQAGRTEQYGRTGVRVRGEKLLRVPPVHTIPVPPVRWSRAPRISHAPGSRIAGTSTPTWLHYCTFSTFVYCN